MNLRNVLRAYSLLRQLSDDESALLNILRALNDNDREQLVASMSDKPQKKSSKKSAGGGGRSPKVSLCVACNKSESSIIHSATVADKDYHPFQPPAGKSKRASGMAAAIRDSLRRSQQAAANDEGDQDGGAPNDLLDPECSFIVNSVSGEKCNASKNDSIHDTTYLSSHEFVAPPASSAAGAGD